MFALVAIDAQDLDAYEGRLGAVQIYRLGTEAVPQRMASLRLASGEVLRIGFDVFGSSSRDLYYRLSYRRSDGSEAELLRSEALSALEEYYIDNAQLSLGTAMPYVHYEFDLSEESLGFKYSGRYQVDIYEQGQEDKPIFCLPLYVYETVAKVEVQLKPSPKLTDRDKKQLVEVALSLPEDLAVAQPDELWLELRQNASSVGECVKLRQFGRRSPTMWYYEGAYAALFWGSNEYWSVEHLMRSAQGLGIQSRHNEGALECMSLYEQSQAQGQSYIARHDYDGLELIRSREPGISVSTEGEYHIATFRLRAEEQSAYDLLLEGQAFDYLPLERKRLIYDRASACYQIDIPLKNGYQEYRYALVPKDPKQSYPEPIIGSHYATSNSYQVLVYYKPWGAKAERLLALFGLSRLPSL